MAYVQCKLCGRPISLSAQGGFGTCPHCGSTVTLPMRADDSRAMLFDRVNRLRFEGEYDAALAACEDLLQTDPRDPEALWYRALCRFGVRYAEDQRTMDFLPVCARGVGSFSEDPDVRAVLQLSTGIVQRTYRREAARIDEACAGAGVRGPALHGTLVQGGGASAESSVTALIKRGNLCLENADFNAAAQFYNQALNLDAENSIAYLGLAMAASRCNGISALERTLMGRYSQEQVQRRSAGQPDAGRINAMCRDLAVGSALTPEQIRSAVDFDLSYEARADSARANRQRTLDYFTKDRNYSLAKRFANPALTERLNALEQNVLGACDGRIAAAESEDEQKRAAVLTAYRSHLDEAEAALTRHSEQLREEMANSYAEAVRLQEAADSETSFGQAAVAFGNLGAWEDAAERKAACLDRVRELRQERLDAEAAKSEAERQAREKAEAERRQAKLKARKKAVRGLIVTACIIVVLAIAGFCVYHYALHPASVYHKAEELANRRDYEEAIRLYESLGDYKDSADRIAQCRQGIENRPADELMDLHRAGKSAEALKGLQKLEQTEYVVSCINTVVSEYIPRMMEEGHYSDALKATERYEPSALRERREECRKAILEKRAAQRLDRTVAAYEDISIAVTADGTVLYSGSQTNGKATCNRWYDILAVAAGNECIFGIRADGTLLYAGPRDFDVSGWTDIVDVSCAASSVLGLRADGTVLATGKKNGGKLDVEDWADVVAVAAGDFHSVGLRADGTVLFAGNDYSGMQEYVSGWSDIIAVAAGTSHTVGLRADGTVMAAGRNVEGQCNTSGLRNIVMIGAAGNATFALDKYGKITVLGKPSTGIRDSEYWSGIVQFSAASDHIVAMNAAGRILALGSNDKRQCSVEHWADVRVPN